jgi:phosphatidylglycerophosphate synthase
MKAALPWAMIVARALGCPLIVLGAKSRWAGGWLGLTVLVALVSDIYDGILARRWGTETPVLRVSDSIADTIFYLGVVGALWLREPEVIRGIGCGWEFCLGSRGFGTCLIC